MAPELTFVVPVAHYHEALLARALASIEAQTVLCEVVVVRDTKQHGAGWARNEGLKQVNTKFVSFLDADDEVLPLFAEVTLSHWQAGRYVYTDWLDEDKPFRAPDCPWVNNSRNVITTLIRTDDARAVGGFDKSLQGLEDTHFYLKLLSAGICGIHVKTPLFRYHKGGKRSIDFQQSGALRATIDRFNAEFGRKPMAQCGTCGGSPYLASEYEEAPIGEPFDGAVLAQTLWQGNRQERGRATGRLYPRTGNGKRLWIDPRDIDQAPHLFSRVLDLPKPPTEDDFQAWARKAVGAQTKPAPAPAPEPMPVIYGEPGVVKPDVAKLLKLYQNAAQ